jgi:transposase-like protein
MIERSRRSSTLDEAPTRGIAISELKTEGKCPEKTAHLQVKYLNNGVEADHTHGKDS